MLEDTAFEHKTLNDELRATIKPDNSINALPTWHYRRRSGWNIGAWSAAWARAVPWRRSGLTTGELIEERHCWYWPDAELRARIVAGWEQFERDLADYKPEAVAASQPADHRKPWPPPAHRSEGHGHASNMAGVPASTRWRSSGRSEIATCRRT